LIIYWRFHVNVAIFVRLVTRRPRLILNWIGSDRPATITKAKCATDRGQHWRAGQKRVVEFGEWLCTDKKFQPRQPGELYSNWPENTLPV